MLSAQAPGVAGSLLFTESESMSLQKKALIVIASVFLLSSLLMHFVSRAIPQSSYLAIEEESLGQDIERALAAWRAESEALDATSRDLAAWERTSAFIRGQAPEFLLTHSSPGTLQALDVDAMVLADAEGRIIATNGPNGPLVPGDPNTGGLLEHLRQHDDIMQHDNAWGRHLGVILLPEHPMLVASRPIVDSGGDVVGSLLLGDCIHDLHLR